MVEELSRRGHRTSEEDTRGGAVYGISVVGDDDDGGCHLYANADHGFGYKPDAKPTAASRWPQRLTEWLTDTGLLK